MIVRILYEKLGPVCFVPHVEMPTLFSRSMRRAGIRQTFTEGMSPHPKISLGPPLPVGVFSLCELADLWLDEEDPSCMDRLNDYLPEGLRVKRACRADGRSLSKSCDGAQYLLCFKVNEISKAAAGILSSRVERVGPSSAGKCLDVIMLKPYEASPAMFVKLLASEGVISSWGDIRIVRTNLGRWDGHEVISLL